MDSVIVNSYTSDFKYKFINDNLYGGIGLSNLEIDLINTKVFQRLRHLRQLAYVNFVFPCAEHSRFVHSLGVLHIMGKITEHLKQKGAISKEDEIKLRIAALLHDIGHYPLSHLGESVYCFMEEEIINRAIKGPTSKLSLLSKLSLKGNKGAHHEKLGKYVIENNIEIINILKSINVDPTEIGSIITGEIGIKNMLYSQLMHSSLDADRLDYLLRDSFQTGVRYGLIDLDYLIRLICVVKDYEIEQGKEKKKVDLVACNIKGQHVIEHYLMSRYFHYSQVIGHKTSLAFEAVAKVLFYKLLKNEKYIFNSYKEIKENVNNEEFLLFTDEILFKHLNQLYQETTDKEYQVLYNVLFNRKRPKTLIEIKDIVNKKDNKPADLRYYNLKKIINDDPEKIEKILGLPREFIGFQEFEVTVEAIPSFLTVEESKTKIEESLREAVRLVDEENKVSLLALDEKSLINKLTDLKSTFIRVFYIEDDKWIDTKEKHMDFRKGIEELIKP